MFRLFNRESKADKDAAASFTALSSEIHAAGLVKPKCANSTETVSVHECGVSLAWLGKLLHVSITYTEVPTEQIIARVFSPVTAKNKKCRCSANWCQLMHAAGDDCLDNIMKKFCSIRLIPDCCGGVHIMAPIW